ncbi:MAG: hypothetical protein QXG76_00235 [Candidatus Bathyarchaeia archaeon]
MKKAMLVFTFITAFVFMFFYIFYPASMLLVPVGWDTPRYIWQIRTIAEDLSFIAKLDFNNFVYIAFGSLFVRLGVNAFIVEKLLPPVLLFILLIEAYFLLTKMYPNGDWKIYTATILSWFGAFRIASDLHNNLLALNMLLPTIYFLHLYLRNAKKHYLGIATFLLVLSSFTHIESTLFLTFILVLSLSTEKSMGKIEKTALTFFLLISILPAATMYYIHIRKLLVYSGGSFKGSVMEIWQWLAYLGPAGLIGIYQLICEVRFRGERDFLKKLFVVWGFISVIFGLVQYFEASFMIFSERAVILFPTPFLAIHKIEEVNYRIIQKIKSSRVKLRFSIPVFVIIFNLSTLLFMNFYNISIRPETYEKMLFLKQKFHNQPIIIVADYSDRYAGEAGQRIYNWGRAVIGNVYTYVGSVYYLRDWMPTPFFYWSSRQTSNMLFQEICANFQSHDDAVVVYGLEFTDLVAIPRDFEAFMEPLGEDNLYIVNVTKLRETEGKLIIPIFQHSRVVYGNWYPSNKSWGDYPLVLECWMTGNIAQTPAIEVLFAIKEKGNYVVYLSYWANETTSLKVQVDENQSQIFNGTGNPEKVIVLNSVLDEGEHLLKVALLSRELSRITSGDKYLRARLDILEVYKVS